MTVEEVRAIRNNISHETIGMSTEELRIYFRSKAIGVEQRIAEIRKKRGIVFEPPIDGSSGKQSHKNEH